MQQPSKGEAWFTHKMGVYVQAQEAAKEQRREAEGAAASRAAKDKLAAERAEKTRMGEVARVAALKAGVEATLAPWRQARDARVGLKWTPTPKPVFISYAAEGTFDELAFVQSLASLLNDSGVRTVWLDKDEGGGHASPDRGVGRAEACAGAGAVIAVLSPAYLASRECAVERDIVKVRREPLEWGGRAHQVPMVCVDATPGAGAAAGTAAGTAASVVVTPPPPGLLSPKDLPPLLLGKYTKPAAAAAVRVVTALRK
jgi:hypothetical protein